MAKVELEVSRGARAAKYLNNNRTSFLRWQSFALRPLSGHDQKEDTERVRDQ
jgi:hypothetical protein